MQDDKPPRTLVLNGITYKHLGNFNTVHDIDQTGYNYIVLGGEYYIETPMQDDNQIAHIQPAMLLQKSKKELKSAAEDYVLTQLHGAADPLHLYVQAHKLSTFFSEAAALAHDEALSEAYKYGKSHTQYDTKIETRETGVTWDYSNCNDAELKTLEADLKEAKARLEKRQKFLQALPEPFTKVDEDTGETMRINPAVRKSTTKVVLSY